MEKLFVVSDIHGMYAELIELLKHWNPSEETLIILGDMIDRGPDSLKVVQHIMALSKAHDVVVLRGNHDQMLLDFIEEPDEIGLWYQKNGGDHTIKSFAEDERILLHSFVERANQLKVLRQTELDFLASTLPYHVVGQVLFTHAGFNPHVQNWQDSSPNDFLWIRGHYCHPNQTGYVNVFGHTPTVTIQNEYGIWMNAAKNYIGIDGACAYGGQLNGLVIQEDGQVVATYTIQSTRSGMKR